MHQFFIKSHTKFQKLQSGNIPGPTSTGTLSQTPGEGKGRKRRERKGWDGKTTQQKDRTGRGEGKKGNGRKGKENDRKVWDTIFPLYEILETPLLS